MTVNRRRFLAGVSVALPGVAAGCISNSDEADDDGAADGQDDDGTTDDRDDDGATDDQENNDDDSDQNNDDEQKDSCDDQNDSDDTNDNDSVPVLTGYTVSEDVVIPGLGGFSHMDTGAVLIATRGVAQQYFGGGEGSGSDGTDAFIEETDFDSGDRLLYVHAFGRQTCYELVLSEEPSVADNGLPLVQTGVSRTAPADQPCGDAITPVQMLLRLSFDPDVGSADVVEVHISGGLNGTEELLVEAER